MRRTGLRALTAEHVPEFLPVAKQGLRPPAVRDINKMDGLVATCYTANARPAAAGNAALAARVA